MNSFPFFIAEVGTIADPCSEYGAVGCVESESSDLLGLAESVVTWLTIAIGVLSVVFIIISAIQIITSGGDAEKVKRARRTLLYSIIGLIVAILAGVITSLVFNITNVIN